MPSAVPTVYISGSHCSEQAAQFATSLSVELGFLGIPAQMRTSPHAVSSGFLVPPDTRSMLMKSAATVGALSAGPAPRTAVVYVPLLSRGFALAADARVELYYALRQSVLHEQTPLVIPVIDTAFLAAARSAVSAPTSAWSLLEMELLREFVDLAEAAVASCFAVTTDFLVADHVATQIANLLRELNLGSPMATIAEGSWDPAECLASTGQRVNSGVLPRLQQAVANGATRTLGGDPLQGAQVYRNVHALDLSSLLLGDAGTALVSRILVPALAGLESLCLSGNGITNVGVRSLCGLDADGTVGAACHPSLTTVDLSHNGLSQPGIADLFLLAMSNPYLRTIAIHGNLVADGVWSRRLASEMHGRTAEAPSHQKSVTVSAVADSRVQLLWEYSDRGSASTLALRALRTHDDSADLPLQRAWRWSGDATGTGATERRMLAAVRHVLRRTVLTDTVTLSRGNGGHIRFALDAATSAGRQGPSEALAATILWLLAETFPIPAHKKIDVSFRLCHTAPEGAGPEALSDFFIQFASTLCINDGGGSQADPHVCCSARALCRVMGKNVPAFCGSLQDELVSLFQDLADEVAGSAPLPRREELAVREQADAVSEGARQTNVVAKVLAAW